MKKAVKLAAGVCVAWLSMSAAHSHDSLYAARIGAVDGDSLARFYEFAFGMHVVLRRGREIMLNFGETDEAAKANKDPLLVIIHRNTDAVDDPVSHLIFYVSDFPVTAQAIEAAGGSIQRGPIFIKQSGDTIGFAVDPAGNQMELIEPPKE